MSWKFYDGVWHDGQTTFTHDQFLQRLQTAKERWDKEQRPKPERARRKGVAAK